MKENLTTLIKEYRNGQEEYLLPIIQKLKPTIIKYAKKLYLYDLEDSMEELQLALMEAVHKISIVEDESKCLTFLVNAIRNRYLELVKKSSKISSNELFLEEQDLICPYWEYEYGDRELMLDLEKLLSAYNTKQRKILRAVVLEGRSCSQAAAEYHVTRQYVNRLKNKWLKQIGKEIFTKEAI